MGTKRLDANSASEDMDNLERMWREMIGGVSKADTTTIRNADDDALWDSMKADLDRGLAKGLRPMTDFNFTPDQVWP